MKKIKNIFCIILSVMMILSLNLNAFALDNNSNNFAENNNVYYEIQELDQNDLDPIVGFFNEEENTFTKDSKNNKVEINSILYKRVIKKMYIEKQNNGTEKRLTNNDIDLINKFKLINNLNNSSIIPLGNTFYDGDTKDIYELTISMDVYELDKPGSVGYKVIGVAQWQGPPSPFVSSEKEVSNGNDCMSFSWGGEYDYEIGSFNRTYIAGDTYKVNKGIVHDVEGNPNLSRGWAFPEFIQEQLSPSAVANYYLAEAKAVIALYKPSFSTGTTKLYLRYCHTYSDVDYSFSLGDLTGVISVTPTTKQWSDLIEITINK